MVVGALAGWGGQECSRGRTHRPWRHAPRPTTRGRPPPPEPPPSRTGARSKSWLLSAGPAPRPPLPSFCAPQEGIQPASSRIDGDIEMGISTTFFSLSPSVSPRLRNAAAGLSGCCSQTPGPGPWGGWVWGPEVEEHQGPYTWQFPPGGGGPGPGGGLFRAASPPLSTPGPDTGNAGPARAPRSPRRL